MEVAMRHQPNPVLNEKERKLLESEPEECFRHAVRRGAISLDEATTHLPPHIAAVVRCIATGERPGGDAVRSAAHAPAVARNVATRGQFDAPTPPQPLDSRERQSAQKSLAVHPQLAQMLNERALTADEALQAAHAMDDLLGRYPTGTRYAAP
jgi:hypothetical protein